MPTVLYVEDEEFDALFMRRAFKNAGLEGVLQVVTDGKQALDYLINRPPFDDTGKYPLPALVLLDLNLPIVSGFEVLEQMKRDPALANLPVVIFSSSPRPEDRLRAKDLGANRYIEKPTSAMDFGDVVYQLKEEWLDPNPQLSIPSSLGTAPAAEP